MYIFTIIFILWIVAGVIDEIDAGNTGDTSYISRNDDSFESDVLNHDYERAVYDGEGYHE